MCLTLKSPFARKFRAKEDIVCYKYLEAFSFLDAAKTIPDLVTPFEGAHVKIGETYKSKLYKRIPFCYDQVDVGLHTFASINAVKTRYSNFIVKCIIPKGARYYIGEFVEDVSLASNELTYVEIIQWPQWGRFKKLSTSDMI